MNQNPENGRVSLDSLDQANAPRGLRLAPNREITAELNSILTACIIANASDIHLSSDGSVYFRVHGKLTKSELTLDWDRTVQPLLTQDEFERFNSGKSNGIDLAISGPENSRFRIHVSSQNEGTKTGAVFRRLPEKLLSLQEIGLDANHIALLNNPKGIIFVTGPTGSGKTTTLASMINYINENQQLHIITIEEPVEYIHRAKQCRITQRSVGIDVPTFEEALAGALRDDPDVILVGEIRDSESASLALRAADTGHLVLATLHTPGAAGTIDRLIGMFPDTLKDNIRMQMSLNLCGIFSQTLVRTADEKGKVAAFEILLLNDAVAQRIRKGETHQIPNEIQTGKKLGMRSLNDSLFDLVKAGKITKESALEVTSAKSDLRSKIGA